VKPDNILLNTCPSGGFVVRLTDFGLAKANLQNLLRESLTQSVIGTRKIF
jgi:serine/threonine protein kinase